MSAASTWWGQETQERIAMPEDETQQISPFRQGYEEGKKPMGEVSWAKAFMIVAVTLILAGTVLGLASMFLLPAEFWTMTP